MSVFNSVDQNNLARCLHLEPSQYHENSYLKFLMNEVEIDDERYSSRNYVERIKSYLDEWLRLDDESNPENPIILERNAALSRIDIKRERIDGQFEIEYDSKPPSNYFSYINLKQLRKKQIFDLLDPLGKLHRYTIKGRPIAT